jgi:Zn-dependent peptidase ImmA (M78 family)/transcriptional regulator with XRE-family HTH domain
VNRLAPSLFDGVRLTIARLYRGTRKNELAKAIGVTPAAITQYEQGRTRPSEAVLAALALHLGFPTTFFERGRPASMVSESHVHFRRLRSTSRLERDRLLSRISLLAELITEIERHVSLPAISIPDIPGVGDDDGKAAERAAIAVRSLWRLGSGPIQHVVWLLEGKGVVVVRPAIDTQHVDAFSTLIAGRPIVVLASDKGDASRSRMDAAHELGHLVMHHDAEPGRQSIEREAQRFAAAFLLPRDAMIAELPRQVRWDAYLALKGRWRVSLGALLYRARTLSILGPDAYQRAQVRLAVRGWHANEPGDIGAPEQPTVLYKSLALIEARRGLNARRLAALLHVSIADFESMVADIASDAPIRPRLKVV